MNIRPIQTKYGAIYADPADHIGGTLAGGAYYEEGLIQIMLGNCMGMDSRRAVDAGGCWGTHSLVFSKHFRQVETFEPQADLIAAMRETFRDTPNVSLHHSALGHCDGLLVHIDDGEQKKPNAGSRGICPPGVRDQRPVVMRALDMFAWGDVGLIKVDTEGAEHLVLFGARETILRCRPVVFFEDHRQDEFAEKHQIWASEVRNFRVLEFLILDAGYRQIHRVGKKNVIAVP